MTNGQRAAAAAEAVRAFRQRVGQFNDPDVHLSVQDLLCDLMHYCDIMKLDFDELLENARGHYKEELEEG